MLSTRYVIRTALAIVLCSELVPVTMFAAGAPLRPIIGSAIGGLLILPVVALGLGLRSLRIGAVSALHQRPATQ
jgi:hypothetical protein